VKSDLLKISVIGSCDKLKIQFIRIFVESKFDVDYLPTLGHDTFTKKILVKDTQTKLIIVVLAGQEFFDKLRSLNYRGSSACIIVFDMSNRESFEKVTYWLEDLRKYTGSNQLIIPAERNIRKIPKQLVKDFKVPVALLGINTKEEEVTSDEGTALAEELNIPYFETSTPAFENSSEIFQYLAKQVITS
jgi:GTPase SAR1 family protein